MAVPCVQQPILCSHIRSEDLRPQHAAMLVSDAPM